MRSKVFIAQSTIPPEALTALEAHADVVWGLPENERVAPKGAEANAAAKRKIRIALNEVIGEIHAIFGYFQYDAELIGAAKNLRVIINPSSGTDNIDLDAATANGIAVVNAAGAAYLAVAEHVIGLSLSLLKSIALPDRDAHATKRQMTNTELFARQGLPHIITGKTLGIIGFGFIGRELARMAIHGFRMNVLAFDPYFDEVEAVRQGVRLVDRLEDLLADSDIVSVNTPLTQETRGLIGAAQLRLMKPTALLINCGRGETVVTADLVDALRQGVIAGAGLDVTDPEPLSDGHPLFDLDNVVLTPHSGGVSAETLPNQSIQSAREGIQVLAGKRPFRLVNPAVWANRRNTP